MPSSATSTAPVDSAEGQRSGSTSALVAEPGLTGPLLAADLDRIPATSLVARLPVELEVSIPVPEFRVRNLLALEADTVIETLWGHADDVPLGAGKVQLAWTEFEVVETQLAVRVTRLA